MDTNEKAAQARSIEFCDRLFARANARLNGRIAGFDRKRKDVFVKSYDDETIWMPAGFFLQNLSTEEIAALEGLPHWDGNNAYELSAAVLQAVECAIRRHRKTIVKAAMEEDSLDYFPDAQCFTEGIVGGQVVRSPVKYHPECR